MYEIALSYRAHTWLVPGVDIKELRALNKAMAPFIPGWVGMSKGTVGVVLSCWCCGCCCCGGVVVLFARSTKPVQWPH